MRLELMLSFGTCSLAICATVGGFFGMNLHSGFEDAESYPHLLLYVSAGAGALASGVFAAFVLSLKRFHTRQQQQVDDDVEEAQLDERVHQIRPLRLEALLHQQQKLAPLLAAWAVREAVGW